MFGVEGENLDGHDAPTQDFVLASGTTFPAGTAAGFLSQAKKKGLTVPMPEGVKSAASSIARNINKVLNEVGAGPSSMLDFYGHPFSHAFDETYFSQCPLRFGDHVAKLGAFPATPAQEALVGCFDIKPVARVTRIEAEGCKRNVRIWRDLDAQQVTSITPTKRGGIGSTTHLWIHGSNTKPPVVHIGRLIVRSTNAAPIFTIEDGAALITVYSCDLGVPAGTPFKVGGAKGNVLTLGPSCAVSNSH